jgi:hypothetical protein
VWLATTYFSEDPLLLLIRVLVDLYKLEYYSSIIHNSM